MDLLCEPPGAEPDGPDYPIASERLLQLASRLIDQAAHGRPITRIRGMDTDERSLIEHLAGMGGALAYLSARVIPGTNIDELITGIALRRSVNAIDVNAIDRDPAADTTIQEDPMLGRKSVETARADIDREETRLTRWQATQATKEAELADLERRIGAELLGIEEPEVALASAYEAISRLRVEVEVAGRTIVAAEAALVEARRGALESVAASCRRRAGAARSRATEHGARTAQLLDQIREHEGVSFGAFVELEATNGHTMIVRNTATATDQLVAEAERLEARAVAAEEGARRPSIEPGAWAALMAAADPDGPEAEQRRQRAESAEEAQAQVILRHERILVARHRWIASRADEIFADRAYHPEILPEGRRTMATNQAKAELQKVVNRAGAHLIVDFDRAAWALEQLGVTIEEPADQVEA